MAINKRTPLAKRKAASPATRRPSALTLQRMEVVEDLLRNLVPHHTIVRRLYGEWGVSQLTVERVIQAVYDRWAVESNDPAHRQRRRDVIRQAFSQNYMIARAKKDLGEATRALRELAKLDGCYPDDRLRVEAQVAAAGVGINLSSLGFRSSEDVRARIAELQDRIATGGVEAMIAGIANAQAGGGPNPEGPAGVPAAWLEGEFEQADDAEPADDTEPAVPDEIIADATKPSDG